MNYVPDAPWLLNPDVESVFGMSDPDLEKSEPDYEDAYYA